MAFDFKKEYKEFYLPKNVPSIVTVPPMNYLAVWGEGDPNQEGGAYQQAIGLLYGIAYTIKMSKKGDHRIEGYFDYVVPPLEGFWQQEGVLGIDYAHKEKFQWISVIRLPDFVTRADFDWAVKEAANKKKRTFRPWSFGLMTRAFASSACTPGPTTTSLPRWNGCTVSWRSRALPRTSRISVCTMRSI